MSIRTTLCAYAALAAFASTIAAPAANAKSSDRTVPAHADGERFSGDLGPSSKSQLNGKVVITQGTLRITGTRAELYRDANAALERVVITGEPAHVEQLDDSDHLMTADAQTVDYTIDTSIAILTGSARAKKQAGGDVAGDVLRYDTSKGTFEAKSDGASLVHLSFEPKRETPAPAGTSRPNP